MAEGEPHPHKARRESLGLEEREVASMLGWPVKKIKDFEAGLATLTPVEEERISIAMDSLANKKRR